MASLGSKLHDFRLRKGMTLKQVADLADCTAAYISQIERDRTSPSIASLKRISAAVGVRIVDFFLEDSVEPAVVIEPSSWPEVGLPGWRANIRQMVRTVKDRQMQPFFTEIAPGGGSRDSYSHQGEEFGLILQGELTLKLGDKSFLVKEGSAFYYSSDVPHSWTNDGDVLCRVVWVVTPPSW
jgi:Predicted transcriptional regulators